MNTMNRQQAVRDIEWVVQNLAAPDKAAHGTLRGFDAILFRANRALAALRTESVPALEVFRIAGGDVECNPNPTADQALECLRDLRECYDEVLRGEAGEVAWRPMKTAPRDGSMLRLLVRFTEHSTEDDEVAATIGANAGEDGWQFAGWCWTHDHFTEGKGEPIGWMPLLDASPAPLSEGVQPAEQPAVPEALRFLLTRIGYWTNARWDQHLRHEFGDERAEPMIAALTAATKGKA